MDVTLANIRREYDTERSLWVLVIGYGLVLLVVLDTSRRLLSVGSGWLLILGLALVLAGVGSFIATLAARRVRATSFGAELWRKFGLDRELLDEIARLEQPEPEAAASLDLLLRDLRSLAAVRNHEAWDAPDSPDPGLVVELAEDVVVRELREYGATERLAPLREVVYTLTQAQRMTLAAVLAERPEELDDAWAAFVSARARLEAWRSNHGRSEG